MSATIAPPPRMARVGDRTVWFNPSWAAQALYDYEQDGARYVLMPHPVDGRRGWAIAMFNSNDEPQGWV